MGNRHQQRRGETSTGLATARLCHSRLRSYGHSPRLSRDHVRVERGQSLHRHDHMGLCAVHLPQHRNAPRQRRTAQGVDRHVQQPDHDLCRRSARQRQHDTDTHGHGGRSGVQRQYQCEDQRQRRDPEQQRGAVHRGRRRRSAAVQLSPDESHDNGNLHRRQQHHGSFVRAFQQQRERHAGFDADHQHRPGLHHRIRPGRSSSRKLVTNILTHPRLCITGCAIVHNLRRADNHRAQRRSGDRSRHESDDPNHHKPRRTPGLLRGGYTIGCTRDL